MKLRITAALLAVVAALGLTACQTKAGSAALVGGDRISESDVNRYLTPESTPYQAQGGGQVVPRTVVLQTLIQEQLMTAALAANNIQYDATDLNNAKQAILQGGTEDDLIKQITQSGFKASFEPVVLRTFELQQVLVSKIGAQSQADLNAAVDKAHLTIKVNPRYGKWDPKTLSLSNVTPPNFLKLDTSLLPST